MMAYLLTTIVVVFGLMSLSFDFGRVTVARSEMNVALEAAARYGATGLADGTAVSRAQAAARQNLVNGTPLELVTAQVAVGNYDGATRTFTAGTTSPNAVRVRVDRTLNPISLDLTLAQVLGMSQFPITGEAYALVAGGTATSVAGPITGFVGLDYFNFNGPLTVRAWDSSTGQVLDPSVGWAAGQTKGPSNLNSGVVINGELQTGGGVSMNAATITKGIKPLPAGFGTYAAPVAPSGATYLGNYNGPSGASQTFGPGVYRFDTFNVPSGKTVTFSGAASLYVGGSMNLAGAVVTSGNLPNNLNLYTTQSSGVDIGTNASSPLYANIYAPNSPMNLNGRTFYGSIIAKGINVNQPFNMYIDARSGTSTSTTTSTGSTVSTIVPKTVR